MNNRVVLPRLVALSDSCDSDSDDGPPAAKRRRVLKRCRVVLEDVSRSKEFWVRSMYRVAANRGKEPSSGDAATVEGIRAMIRKGSHVSVNAKELADMFAELQALRKGSVDGLGTASPYYSK